MSSCMNGRKVLGLELVASDDLLAKYSKLEVAMMHTGRVETHHRRKHQKDTTSSRFLRIILSGEIAKSINASANELHQLDDNTSVSSRSISQVLKELDIKELAAQPTLSELDEVKVPQVMPSSGPLTFLNQINRLLCAENNCNMLDLTTENDYNVDSHSTHEESINTTPDERAVKSTESNLLKSFTTTLKWEVLERFMSVPVNDTNVVSSMSNNAAPTTNQSNITTHPTEILINTVSNESDLNLSNKDDLLLSDADDVAEPNLLLTHLNSNLRCEHYELLPSMANDQDNNEDNHSLVISTCEDRIVPLSADMPMIKSQSTESDLITSCKTYKGVEKECPSEEEETKPTLKSYEVKKKKKKTVVGDVLRLVAKKWFNKPIKTDTIPQEHASDSQILVDNGQTGCDRPMEAINERVSSVSPKLVDDGHKSIYQEFLALFVNSDKAECHEKDVCSSGANLNDHLQDSADLVTDKSRTVDDGCSTVSPASVERFPSSSPDMIDDQSLGSNLEDNHSLVLSTCEDGDVPLSADMPMIKPQSMDRDQSTSCKSYEGVNNKCPSEEEMKPTLKSYEVKKKKKSVVGDVLRFVAKKRFNKPIKTDTIPEERASESQILVDNGQEFLALFVNSGKAECHESDVCSSVVNLNDHQPGDADMVTEKSRNVDDGCSTDSPASVERFPLCSPDKIDDHSLGTNRLRGAAMVDTNEVYDDYQRVQPTFKLTAGDRVSKVFHRMRSGGFEITDQSKEIQQDDMDDTLESVNQKSSSSQSTESGGIISITCSTISSLKSVMSSLPRQNNHATSTTTDVPSVVKCLTLPKNVYTRNDTNPSIKYFKQGRRCVSFADLDEIAHYGTDEEATLITHETLASNSFLSLLEKFANDIMDKTCIFEAEVEDDDDSTFSYDEN